jgi:hypothetical protein
MPLHHASRSYRQTLRAENAHHDFFDVWSAKLRDLKEFGIGHLLYFHFLQV